MSGIDWGAIRERGEQGMLTADEAEALIDWAQRAISRRLLISSYLELDIKEAHSIATLERATNGHPLG